MNNERIFNSFISQEEYKNYKKFYDKYMKYATDTKKKIINLHLTHKELEEVCDFLRKTPFEKHLLGTKGRTNIYHLEITEDEYNDNIEFYSQFKASLDDCGNIHFELDRKEYEVISDFRNAKQEAKERDALMHYNMSKSIEKMVELISKEENKIREQNVIDDIIAIHHHIYENYNEYVENKKRLIEAIRYRNTNNTKTFFEGKPYNLSYTTYVEPYILSEETFDYITKGEHFNAKE